MRLLGVVGRAVRWLFTTAIRVAGIGAHGGVDPKGADYLYRPRPPEFRP